MENKKIDIEMSNMIGKTYFQIATWYNQDFNTEKERQEALKQVCAEILQQILEDTFLQLDGVSKTEVKTISSDNSKKITNQTLEENRNMFAINEDAIIRALREKK